VRGYLYSSPLTPYSSLFTEQGLESRPDVIEDLRLGPGDRVHAVGLHQRAVIGDLVQQAGNQRDLPLTGQLLIDDGKTPVEVSAVIGWQANAGEDDLAALLPAERDQLLEIMTDFGKGQTAQAIVGPEGNDDNVGTVLP